MTRCTDVFKKSCRKFILKCNLPHNAVNLVKAFTTDTGLWPVSGLSVLTINWQMKTIFFAAIFNYIAEWSRPFREVLFFGPVCWDAFMLYMKHVIHSENLYGQTEKNCRIILSVNVQAHCLWFFHLTMQSCTLFSTSLRGYKPQYTSKHSERFF